MDYQTILIEILKLILGVSVGSAVGSIIVYKILAWNTSRLARKIIEHIKDDKKLVNDIKKLIRDVTKGVMNEIPLQHLRKIEITIPDPKNTHNNKENNTNNG